MFSMHTNELATCIQAAQPPSGIGGGDEAFCGGIGVAVVSVVAASSLSTVASPLSVFSSGLPPGSAMVPPSPGPGPAPGAGAVPSAIVAISIMHGDIQGAEAAQSCARGFE